MRSVCSLSTALALGLALSLAGCDLLDRGGPSTPKTIALSPLGHELVGQSNAFGVDLFVQTADGEDGNLMLSPLSASIALTMLLNGTDGDTYTQLCDALGYAPDVDLDAINRSYQGLQDQLLSADRKV